MSSGMVVRCLLKNAWYLSSSGFNKGYVYIYGSRVENVGAGEPEPEYELSDLLYDFEGDAVAVHGYSVILDVVEYVVRGIQDVDLSIFTKEELKKLAKVGVVNAYTSGVTLPVTMTDYPEVVADIARENGIRIGLIADRGAVSRTPFTPLLEVENGYLYHEDRKVGELKRVVCSPLNLTEKCLIVDARGYGNTLTAIEEVYRHVATPEVGYYLLTGFYRVVEIDSGYLDKNSASDIIVYDTRNPMKAIPLIDKNTLYTLLRRSSQPDLVIIGGDVFYEKGENLAIPVARVNEILKKKILTS